MKQMVLFCFGGLGYVALEFLYRGRSHLSMFAAGGLCFLLLGKLRSKRLSRGVKAALGMLGITVVELMTGLLVNRDYRVWDYRQQPFHFRGQICAGFMLLWLPLSLVGMRLYGWAERKWDSLIS